MNGKLYIEFLQNPLSGQNFTYRINNDGTPITYEPNGEDIVDKTFQYPTSASQPKGRIAKTDNEFEDLPFNVGGVGFDDITTAIAINSGNTNMYVGGRFKTYNGVVKTNLRVLNLTGGTPTYSNSLLFNGPVSTISIQANSGASDFIVVGGSFVSPNSSPYQWSNIIKLNTLGQIDTSFQQGSGFNSFVNKIVRLNDGSYLVGGNFIIYNSTSVNRFTKLNANGTLNTGYNNIVNAFGCFDKDVNDIFVQADGKHMIVGDFRTFNQGFAGCIVRLTGNGAKDLSFNYGGGFNSPVGETPSVKTIARDLTTGDYYFGGRFNSYNGVAKSNVVKVATNGTIISSFSANTNGEVNDIVVDAATGDVIIGGKFSLCNGEPCLNVVRLNSAGVVQTDGSQGFNNRVRVIVPISGGTDYMFGGDFTQIVQSGTVVGDIPIGDTMEETQANTLNNLSTFNQNDNITYQSVDNKIVVSYLTAPGEGITYTDIVDIDDYVHIYWETSSSSNMTLVNQPMELMPIYNPIQFEFVSENYNKKSFKYLVRIYDSKTGEVVAKQRVSPDTDGVGRVDISRIISSFVGYDYTGEVAIQNATNSYFNYDISFGEEYFAEWGFDTYKAFGEGDAFVSNIELYQASATTPHPYVVGDLIVVVSDDINIAGLHQVVEVPSLSSVVINTIYNNSGSTVTAAGSSTYYADSRNVAYMDELTVSNLTAFNGAVAWTEYYNWRAEDYIVSTIEDSIETNAKFLTRIPKDNFYIKLTQDVLLNYALYIPPFLLDGYTQDIVLNFETSQGTLGQYPVYYNGPTDGVIVSQVNVSPFVIGATNVSEDIEWYDVWLSSNDVRATEKIRFNIDHRCKIEPYEIMFLDLMGSFASFSFPLRSRESGTVDRDMFKKYFPITQTTGEVSYDTTDRGSTIVNVTATNSFELNTDWMTDEMSILFSEMIKSPITLFRDENNYYSCIIEEKDYETLRQKNKTLIRRSVKVTLANNNIVNI